MNIEEQTIKENPVLNDFRYAYFNDTTVYQMVGQDAPLESIVAALVKEKEALREMLLKMEMKEPLQIIISK